MATLTWYGFKIRVRSYQIKGEALRKIGINPEYLRSGVEVCLASPSYFRRINEILGTKPEALAGIYISRIKKVLVPDDIGRLELCHEILHALLDGQRESLFPRLVIEQVRLALTNVGDPSAVKFFREIAGRTNGGYDLSDMIRMDIPGLLLHKKTRLFITEVFAFGGTKVIFERKGKKVVEKEMGEVPPELKAYFERNLFDPQLLEAPLQKIA